MREHEGKQDGNTNVSGKKGGGGEAVSSIGAAILLQGMVRTIVKHTVPM